MKAIGKNIKAPRNWDAGYDLYCNEQVVLAPRSSVVVDTDVRVQIPAGYFGKIFARSGLSVNQNIEVGAGVIDSGYTGSIKVHLYNHSNVPTEIPVGTACCQMVIMPCYTPDIEYVDCLNNGARGDRGFGSTDGVHNAQTT